MPRTHNHFPTNLLLDPFHCDFFSVLKATSPIVTFHCPSPFTQKNFSFIYSIHFPRGEEAKSLLVTGIHRLVLLFSPYFIFILFISLTFRPLNCLMSSSFKDVLFFLILGCLKSMRKNTSIFLIWACYQKRKFPIPTSIRRGNYPC